MRSLFIVENEVEFSQTAASIILAAARTRLLEPRASFDLMLTGGNSPRPLYRYLAERHAQTIDWSRVRFFWGDERDVPPDHPDSNFRMAKELLLDPLGIEPKQIFRFYPEIQPATEAALEYDRSLRATLLNSDRKPHLDFVLLGLGDDGHVASIFPEVWKDCTEAEKRGQWTWAGWVPHLKTHRLTVLPHILLSARNILFLVSGEKKAKILKEVLESETTEYPAEIFVNRADWLADRPAASLLSQAA